MVLRRLRIFFEHASAFNREIIEEHTIENDTDLDLVDLIWPLSHFKLGLKVIDSDGSELPYLPKDEIKNRAQEAEKLGVSLPNLEKMLEGSVLWVKVPFKRAIKPKETRIIKLRYKDERNIHGRIRGFFASPSYTEIKRIEKADGFDTFYVITAPENYVLDLDMMNTSGIDRLHVNETKSVISIRAPYKAGNYKLYFGYTCLLPRGERFSWMLLMMIICSLTLLPLLDHYSILSILDHDYNYYSTIVSLVISLLILQLNTTVERAFIRLKTCSVLLIVLNMYVLIKIVGEWSVAGV